ncbi:MAG: methyltransferase domain-containing protein [Patescibacteria group bacterium]
MDKHTKRVLKAVWANKILAKSRAQRAGSSAPTNEELKIYQRELAKALRGKKDPEVLVLGATPELRDLAISLDARTLAVDISAELLRSMRSVMATSDSLNNIEMRADWLSIGRRLPRHNYDAILADASLNNVASKQLPRLLKSLYDLLKPGGYFITRNVVYRPEITKQNLDKLQRYYNQRKTTWLMYWIEAGYYTDWQPAVYDPRTKLYNVKKILSLFTAARQRGEVRLRQADIWKFNNVARHGKGVIHVVFSKADFERLIKRYYEIVAVHETKRWHYSKFIPIYVLRSK